jgi:hypothetical protein
VTAEPPAAPTPIERSISFEYDYRMRCPNGHFSQVLADLFHSQWIIADGTVPCEACGESIAVINENIAVRNPDDLALDRDRISELAWYHTSTHADWPPPGYAATIAEELQWSRQTMPEHVFAETFHREQTKALHLGTYESAIENVHRRIRNQADRDNQFYLHRVSVNLAADDIDPEVRHESHDEASQLTLDDLAPFQAVRYINVEESPGSTSLAIKPAAIATIQTLPLPRTSLSVPPAAHIVEAEVLLDAELEDIGAQLQGLPSHDFVTAVKLRHQGNAGALRRTALERRAREAKETFEEQMDATYLGGINPVVREHFTATVDWPPDGRAESQHRTFRVQTAALTRSVDVVAELAQQPVRATL